MKAISLTQPWASLVVYGLKQFETRSWSTDYRGPLAIHASKGFPTICQALCTREPFADALKSIGVHEAASLPLGQVIGTVTLTGCYQIGFGRLTAAERLAMCGVKPHPELEFGDYQEGRWMWRLENASVMRTPAPAKGALRFWEWPVVMK